jgi:ribose transport system substrate-binding protein
VKPHPICLFGFLVVTLSLVCCSGSPSTEIDKRGVIGISLLFDSDPFFIQMSEAMEAHAKAAGYEVNITWANRTPQEKQVDDFVEQGVNAIVLSPANPAVAASVRRANGRGIPVFTADIALLARGVEIVSHVATDNYRGGQLAADAMFQALQGSGRVAIVDHPTVDSAILRARGFLQRAAELRQKEGGTFEVVTDPGRGSHISWFQPQQILRDQPDIDGVFALNDILALQVVEELEKQNKLDDVVVVGFDGLPPALEAVDAGKITAEVLQHPELIAERVINAIVAYRAGQDVPPEHLISPTIQRSRRQNE